MPSIGSRRIHSALSEVARIVDGESSPRQDTDAPSVELVSEPRQAHHLAFYRSNLAGGGVQRMTLNLAGTLAQRGHRVDLVELILAQSGSLPSARRLRPYFWNSAEE